MLYRASRLPGCERLEIVQNFRVENGCGQMKSVEGHRKIKAKLEEVFHDDG